MRKGETLLHELDNLRVILQKYQKYLQNQKANDFFRNHKTTSTKPSRSNTDFDIIKRAPSRPPKVKRSDAQKDVYARADRIMNQVRVGAFYANFEVTDEAMGIAGPEFDGGREGTLRSRICRKIIAQLGSDSFCI